LIKSKNPLIGQENWSRMINVIYMSPEKGVCVIERIWMISKIGLGMVGYDIQEWVM
jgi:hypothetical protein